MGARPAKRNGDLIVLRVENIKDANQQSSSVKCKCIKDLNILGHGGPGFQNVVSVRDPNRKTPGYGRLSATLQAEKSNLITGLEMFEEMKAGGKICKPCTLILRGCSAGKGKAGKGLLKAIAKKTGCKAKAYDTPTGMGISMQDGDLPGNGYIFNAPNVTEKP
jgi:hypothetical protein